MLNVKIGAKTEKAMKTLDIQSFPFTEFEVKSKFRTAIKKYHPDKIKESNRTKEQSVMTRRVIEAYTHIRNLAISNNYISNFAKDILKAENQNTDIFELFDDCKRCKGTGEIVTHHKASITACDRCLKRTFTVLGYAEYISSGEIKITCRSCKGTGKFRQRNSKRVVPCLICAGKGYKFIKCPKCKGTRVIYTEAYITKSDCYLCGGTGRVKINPFNPVIPKGAVL